MVETIYREMISRFVSMEMDEFNKGAPIKANEKTTSDTIRIVEWNINQRSGHKDCLMPDWIIKELLKIEPRPNIIVLTELFKRDNWKELCEELCRKGEYQKPVITDNSAGKQNDVAIFVSNNIEIIDNSVEKFKTTPDNKNPNYLYVELKYGPKSFAIAGVRIIPGYYYTNCPCCGKRNYIKKKDNGKEIECKLCKKRIKVQWEKRNSTYPDCRDENQEIIDKIKEKKVPVLIVGDFNTLRRNTTEKDWNIKILKQAWGKDGFEDYIPEKGGSWGQEFSEYAEFPNDHLIISKGDFLVCDVKYDRDFTESYPTIYCKGRDLSKIQDPYPDHAMLCATVKI